MKNTAIFTTALAAMILKLSLYSPTSSGLPSKAQEDDPEFSAKVERLARVLHEKLKPT